jgi:hypothetical protein
MGGDRICPPPAGEAPLALPLHKLQEEEGAPGTLPGEQDPSGVRVWEGRVIEVGTRVRRWEVLEPAHHWQGKPRWLCCCDCGRKKVISERHLEYEVHLQCPCTFRGKRYTQLIKVGDTFGSWTVRAEVGVYDGKRFWLVQCVCGKYAEGGMQTHKLVSGKSKSCGCRRKK